MRERPSCENVVRVKQGHPQERGRDESQKTKLTKPFCSGQGLKKSIDKGGNLLVTKNNLTHEVSADVKTIPEKPQTFMKRIGSNYYVVSVHFSDTNKENINDKIQRLIRNEIINAKAVGQ